MFKDDGTEIGQFNLDSKKIEFFYFSVVITDQKYLEIRLKYLK